jgi:ATP-dependent exoDNAse (exonuclease V) alpha subunit
LFLSHGSIASSRMSWSVLGSMPFNCRSSEARFSADAKSERMRVLMGERLVTTREVLDEERRMIAFARDGRGNCRPLGDGEYTVRRDWLGEDQRAAVRHVLESPDRVIAVRGAAGVGKTSMMQEAVEAIEAFGRRVFTFAPSANASRGVLREEGFAEADTVARLLVDEKLQSGIRGQVIWIDEAGLLSSRTTARLFEVAERLDARVILSGDRRQHGSVERGAVLRLLEEEAGVVPVEIREIRRQTGEYRDAVRALSIGRIEEGVRRLDRLGWIREVADGERYQMLAKDYVSATTGGKSALVVSPTHLEGEWITDEIRGELKRLGQLRGQERRVERLVPANLTEAERGDPLNYERGDVLVFHQNAKAHRKGERLVVGEQPLPLDQAARFQVYRPSILPIAAGDLLRITRNGSTIDGKHRLNNGATYTVKGFDRHGDIVLTNRWTVAADFGHLAHGYCVTSHASQGRTVDRVLIGLSSPSYPAASQEQLYVSVSRGRTAAAIYTDNRRSLLDAVRRSDPRMTATELASRRLRQRAAAVQRWAAQRPSDHQPLPARETPREELIHE